MKTLRGAVDRPLTYEGAYDATRVYHPRMIVTYSGGLYLSVGRSLGVTPDPTLTTPWLPFSGVVSDTDDVISTVGAGMPSYAGRANGDLHFNLTNATEYVLTGSDGVTVTDDFTGLGNGVGLNGRAIAGTVSGTWTAVSTLQGDGTGRVGNNSGGAGWATGVVDVVNADTMRCDISVIVKYDSIGAGYGTEVNARGSSVAGGYRVFAQPYDGIHLAVGIDRNGITVAGGGSAGALTPVIDTTVEYTLQMTVDGSVVTAFWNGVAICSYTDGAPLTGSSRTQVGFGTEIADHVTLFTAVVGSTRTWMPTFPGVGPVIGTIKDEGTSLPQRPAINFIGTAVTAVDNAGANRTDVTVTVPSAGITVQDENVTIGSGVTQLDFQGVGVAAAAGTGEVVVTVPGPAGVITAKGDLIVGTGPASIALLPVGTNTYILTADSTQASGVKWAALPATGIIVQDENVTIGSGVTQLDFQGGGVVAAAGTGEVVITVRGNTCRAVTTTQTLLATDEVVLASNTISLTLPTASTFVGRRMTIKNIGTGVLTFPDTIDGTAGRTLAVQYSSIDVVTDGTNWFEV